MSQTIHLPLANALLESALCASFEEAVAVADAIVQDVLERHPNEKEEPFRQFCIAALQDYFCISQEDASNLMQTCTDDDSSRSSDSDTEDDESVSSNDEEAFIVEGECELCERVLKLTKPHLIPKSTWARIETKLLHAAAAIREKHDPDRAKRILGEELQQFMSALQNDNTNNKSSIRQFLQQTCRICRPCHSAIHKTHDNMTLALHYNTVEKLLQHDGIYKFCQWANKQKPGKYAIHSK